MNYTIEKEYLNKEHKCGFMIVIDLNGKRTSNTAFWNGNISAAASYGLSGNPVGFFKPKLHILKSSDQNQAKPNTI